jgi:hypothetical protein
LEGRLTSKCYCIENGSTMDDGHRHSLN